MAIFGLQVEYKDSRAATEPIPKEYMKNKALLYSSTWNLLCCNVTTNI
jgi:hypothetical protein